MHVHVKRNLQSKNLYRLYFFNDYNIDEWSLQNFILKIETIPHLTAEALAK